MHDIHQFTVDHLDAVLTSLEGAGFTFVRIDDKTVFPQLNGATAKKSLGEACSKSADCGSNMCHAAGFCTQSCEGYCPDTAGKAPTFCIAATDAGTSGICVAKAAAQNQQCNLLGDTHRRHPAPLRGKQRGAGVLCARLRAEPGLTIRPSELPPSRHDAKSDAKGWGRHARAGRSGNPVPQRRRGRKGLATTRTGRTVRGRRGRRERGGRRGVARAVRSEKTGPQRARSTQRDRRAHSDSTPLRPAHALSTTSLRPLRSLRPRSPQTNRPRTARAWSAPASTNTSLCALCASAAPGLRTARERPANGPRERPARACRPQPLASPLASLLASWRLGGNCEGARATRPARRDRRRCSGRAARAHAPPRRRHNASG